MQATRRFFYGPTPEEQKRKCNSLIRSNTRKLDRDLANLKALESKTKSLIVAASKRAQRNATSSTQIAAQARQETRIYAKELVRVRKQVSRLTTSKATLTSVGMQVNEAFAVKKIEGSIKNSVGIMKDVNTLVRLPELTSTMRELSQELMKAGIIEEMVEDTLDTDAYLEDEEEEVEMEVDKVLGEVLKDRVGVPDAQVPSQPVTQQPVEEEGEEELASEEMLAQMRGRLEALKS